MTMAVMLPSTVRSVRWLNRELVHLLSFLPLVTSLPTRLQLLNMAREALGCRKEWRHMRRPRPMFTTAQTVLAAAIHSPHMARTPRYTNKVTRLNLVVFVSARADVSVAPDANSNNFQ